MENHAFLFGIIIVFMIPLTLLVIKNLFYTTSNKDLFAKRIRQKKIRDIDVVTECLYYNIEKQQIRIRAYAGPFTLRLKTIYYKNLRFSIHEFAAWAQGYLSALIMAYDLSITFLKLKKDIVITVNGKKLSETRVELNKIIKTFDDACEEELNKKKNHMKETENRT